MCKGEVWNVKVEKKPKYPTEPDKQCDRKFMHLNAVFNMYDAIYSTKMPKEWKNNM